MMDQRQKNMRKTAAALTVVVFSMAGLAFASVPLYNLFCKITGYGGTPQIDRSASGTDLAANAGIVSDRVYTVRFDANTNNGLSWKFKPVQNKLTLKIGEEKLAFYEATNYGDKTITGTATYNVTPYKIATYFNKVDCFCFTEQTLRPGETVSMPVSFYIDKAILDDKNVQEVGTITLSYTFFPSQLDTAENKTQKSVKNEKIKG